jgi:hypothetical protein
MPVAAVSLVGPRGQRCRDDLRHVLCGALLRHVPTPAPRSPPHRHGEDFEELGHSSISGNVAASTPHLFNRDDTAAAKAIDAALRTAGER